MSKAFTKEQDQNNEQDSELDSSTDRLSPQINKFYMTPAGAEKIRQELHQLLHTERPKVVETVSWAASNGDRSENGDYIYGKRRLREIDRRIRFLTQRLEKIEVINPLLQKSNKVLFGATVTVQDEEENIKKYQIVGIDEAEPSQNKISFISPIAKSLLQSQAGDVVTITTPKGLIELEVLKIEYI